MVADYSTEVIVERDEGGAMVELAGGVAFSLCMWKLHTGVNDSVSGTRKGREREGSDYAAERKLPSIGH
jgi:hypothetical protein